MRLSDVLRADLIRTDLDATDRDSTLHAIAATLADGNVVSDAGAVAAALIAREDSHTTAMGNGMAIPHTTMEGLPAPILTLATSREPIPFGDVPGEDAGDDGVRVFFVLLSPPGHEAHHIKCLARICRLARHAELLEGILAAETPAQVADALLVVDAEHV